MKQKRSHRETGIIWLLLFSFLLIFFSCERGSNQLNMRKITEKDEYYDGTPEISLDMYCHLNGIMTDEQRLDICGLRIDSSVVSVEINLQVSEGQIDLKKSQLHYFSIDGHKMHEAVTSSSLNEIFNSVNISSLPVFMNLNDGLYQYRVELSDFCRGYIVEFNFDEVKGTAAKASEEQLEKP